MAMIIQQGGRSWTADMASLDELSRKVKMDTIRAFQAAFKKTVNTALAWVLSQVTPTIAMDTDLMRAGFDNAFEENTTIMTSSNIAEFEFEFNLDRWLNSVIYAAYHIVEHPDIAFPTGYQHSTTIGTRPLTLDFLEHVHNLIESEFEYNLELWGFVI